MATLLLPESTPELRARNLAKKIRDTGFLWQDGALVPRYFNRDQEIFRLDLVRRISKYYGNNLLFPNGEMKDRNAPKVNWGKPVEFTPISDEFSKTLIAYHKASEDAWQAILKRNGY